MEPITNNSKEDISSHILRFPGMRKDFKSFFDKSAVLETDLNHNPIIIFVQSKDETSVILLNNANDVFRHKSIKDSDNCIAQWPGKYRSDFIQFTVQDLKEALSEYKNTSKTFQI